MSWQAKEWNEVLEIRSGRGYKEVENPAGKYPILGSAGKVMGYANKFICEEGTTIIGRKGTINNPMFIESKFWNVDTAFGLLAGDGLDKRFLFYFCRSFDFESLDRGSGRPSLVKSDLLKVKIPIPPLPEQNAIVKILDEAFAKIDQAKANIEKNIENAKELFQSKLNEIFSQRGEGDTLSLPKGWEEKSLGEVVSVSSGGTPSKKEATFWGGHIPWVSPKDMKSLNIVDSRDKITSKALAEGRAKLHDIDTVLIVVRSGILSRTIPLAITRKEITINQDLKALRVKSKLIPKYLLNFLRANETLLLSKVTRGATVHRLETPTIKRLRILFPKKEVQIDINNLVDLLESHMNTFQNLHEQKIKDLKDLKKSLLQKAFSGELTKADALV